MVLEEADAKHCRASTHQFAEEAGLYKIAYKTTIRSGQGNTCQLQVRRASDEGHE